MPLSWAAGDAFGLVVLDHQKKTAADLLASDCSLTVQLARASTAGELARTDEEGPCIVTDAPVSLRGLAPDPQPVCAGAVRVRFGPVDRTVSLCDPTQHPPPQAVDCGDASRATNLRASSAPDELPGDELGAFELSVPGSGEPLLSSPEPQGEGTALWPEGELVVEWGGVPGDSVEIVVGARDVAGPVVRCFVPDTGQFTVPARLVAPYRDGIGTLEVARITQTRGTVDGFDMRVSSRVATAAWLFNGVVP
jgi:hypothetical protein